LRKPGVNLQHQKHEHFKKQQVAMITMQVVPYLPIEGTVYTQTVELHPELYCVLLKVTFVDCTNIVPLLASHLKLKGYKG
jgi:hypothetical protein